MLEKIEKPELETVELRSDGKYGKFVLAPLERGYGTTLGNSLRRAPAHFALPGQGHLCPHPRCFGAAGAFVPQGVTLLRLYPV